MFWLGKSTKKWKRKKGVHQAFEVKKVESEDEETDRNKWSGVNENEEREEECQGICGSTEGYLSLCHGQPVAVPGKGFWDFDTGADRRPVRLFGRRVSRSSGAGGRCCGATPAAWRRVPSRVRPGGRRGRPGVSAGASTRAPRVAPPRPPVPCPKPLVSPVWEPCCRSGNPPPSISPIGGSSELVEFLPEQSRRQFSRFDALNSSQLGQGVETNQGNRTDNTDRCDGPSGKGPPGLFYFEVCFVHLVGLFHCLQITARIFRAGSHRPHPPARSTPPLKNISSFG